MARIDDAQLADAIEEFERDGATVLRGVVDLELLDRLGTAIDRMMAEGTSGHDRKTGGGRFFGDVYTSAYDPEFRHFVDTVGLAGIAGELMRTNAVRFFYDQLLVKEPGTDARTPWHQDRSYWPVTGDQILTTWIPIDAAGPDNGVVSYVRGSHKWDRFFPAQSFGSPNGSSLADAQAENTVYDDPDGPGLRTLSDVHRHPENYSYATWEVAPGDIIIHHPMTVHGAAGNASNNRRRRAIALRWLGEEAYWDDTRPHVFRRYKDDPRFPYPSLAQGERMVDPAYPLMWERTTASA
ncbi:phytanoyl-CoA dioxygenase family protein [Mesobacterium pallidum]|uniref:phytanoyl-CoA dioxygenase family protein n=1 Tax=Mesobacterium pallidum TaxID=2872037 RepID=UPI001EE2AAF8|nr:phytanoyl-CoA dioxygenase family protein [Mesobacterium pallidum]